MRDYSVLGLEVQQPLRVFGQEVPSWLLLQPGGSPSGMVRARFKNQVRRTAGAIVVAATDEAGGSHPPERFDSRAIEWALKLSNAVLLAAPGASGDARADLAGAFARKNLVCLIQTGDEAAWLPIVSPYLKRGLVLLRRDAGGLQ